MKLEATNEEEELVIIEGSHASKIVSIAQTLLRIQRKEPGAKALVFSSVRDVVTIVEYQ